MGPGRHRRRGRARHRRPSPRARRAVPAPGGDRGLHDEAENPEATDWRQIAALYGALLRLDDNPVVALNHAVAVSRASGPEAGLTLVDALVTLPALAGYHLLPSVRGDLLMQLGRQDEARVEFERAAALAKNAREKALLLARAAACGD